MSKEQWEKKEEEKRKWKRGGEEGSRERRGQVLYRVLSSQETRGSESLQETQNLWGRGWGMVMVVRIWESRVKGKRIPQSKSERSTCLEKVWREPTVFYSAKPCLTSKKWRGGELSKSAPGILKMGSPQRKKKANLPLPTPDQCLTSQESLSRPERLMEIPMPEEEPICSRN